MSATKHFTAGEKSKAVCENCKKVVDTTFGASTSPVNDELPLERDVLVASCDNCGQVVAIPAQSFVLAP